MKQYSKTALDTPDELAVNVPRQVSGAMAQIALDVQEGYWR